METYEQYKDSGVEWVGNMPSTWKIAYISNVTYENKIKNEDLLEKNLLSLSYGRIIRKDIDLAFGLLPSSFDGYQIVEPGCIVLRMTDLQNDKRSLRSAIARERGIITSAYIGLNTRESMDANYLAWLIHFYDLRKVFYSLGGGVRQSVNYKEIGKIPVLVPSDEEQRQIAAFLDSKTGEVDGVVGKLRRQVELLERYRRELIAHTVTRGLDPHAPMRDTGGMMPHLEDKEVWFGELPEGWSAIRIKRLADINNGLTYSPENLSDHGTPVLRSNNIRNGKLDKTDLIYVDLDIPDKAKAARGDVLICSANGSKKLIGKSAVIDEDGMAFGAFIMIARPYCNSRYFYYLLNSDLFNYYLPTYLTTTINQLTVSNFGNMIVPFSDDATTQQLIADYLDAKTAEIDSAIAGIKRQIELLGDYRKQVINDAVTGKIRVGEAA
ncbi:restriction endonuclease subunit S [Canibacter zhoujuaniae]|uniref:restriction endonuclease subunit S n=1 Tax=Canibacter zhoujuaniae TaxID=2708343 RepID=UPI00142162C3|nr:restriction endonuclease subunit S [Canibacter zhoujuaniae]